MTQMTLNQMEQVNGGSWEAFFTGVGCGAAIAAGIGLAAGSAGLGAAPGVALALAGCGYKTATLFSKSE